MLILHIICAVIIIVMTIVVIISFVRLRSLKVKLIYDLDNLKKQSDNKIDELTEQIKQGEESKANFIIQKEEFEKEKDEFIAGKEKLEKKNRKIWEMSEAVYKEKKKVDEQNEKLEEAKASFKEKNKKLWNQSIAVHKEKERIEIIKQDIEIKHKNITDSINYARMIQTAILPSKEILEEYTKDFFILYKPRDIVSGDFYWFKEINGKLVIALADCTGHGVPGAFMSMLGIAFLNEIVSKEEVRLASDVLSLLRVYVINALKQKGEIGETRDGMDIAVCVIDIEPDVPTDYPMDSYKLQFSGANNPLYVITKTTTHPDDPDGQEKIIPSPVHKRDSDDIMKMDGTSDITKSDSINNEKIIPASISSNESPREGDTGLKTRHELIEFKGNKMPIGIHLKMDEFTNHNFELKMGDTLYLFSDGFADQFGGPQGKKFKYKPFKNLLLENYDKTLTEQKMLLDNTIVEWINFKEQETDISRDQIDDICILGIRM